MPELTIVYWRDIPAQIIIGRGRRAHKAPLPERFEQAIDRAAMKSGAAGTDDYLAQWRKADPIDVTGAPEKLAQEWVEKLDREYDTVRIKALIDNDGHNLGEP